MDIMPLLTLLDMMITLLFSVQRLKITRYYYLGLVCSNTSLTLGFQCFLNCGITEETQEEDSGQLEGDVDKDDMKFSSLAHSYILPMMAMKLIEIQWVRVNINLILMDG